MTDDRKADKTVAIGLVKRPTATIPPYITFENRTDRSIKILCDADRGRYRRNIDAVPPGKVLHIEASSGDMFRFECSDYSDSYRVTDSRTQHYILQDESCPVTASYRRYKR